MQTWQQFLFFLFLPLWLGGQDFQEAAISIHQVESADYAARGQRTTSFYDSIHQFRYAGPYTRQTDSLQKRVFGYHPYWGGSAYLNYRWDLLTDLCHFSYEVDPATGFPVTTHNWSTSPVLDSALVHGVSIHLCVTLFSGHSLFFTSAQAQQTLIDQVIVLLIERNAHGVNMDVEALPSIYKEEFLSFIISLAEQLEQHIPGAELSIAAPAVNWSDKFNIPVLNDYLDFFMVMAYDYYWGGSSLAGPVSPLHPMVSYSTYCFSRTASYYQAQGVPNDKLVLGVPYYAYQWKTEGQYAPSPTIGQGAAYTYRYVADNNSGNYNPENKQWEPNSLSPYFSFESGGWNQCFLDDAYSMGRKFDVVNRRNLAGVGIWALGYDNGYDTFWDLIRDKFSVDNKPINADTLYDSGGPAFDYFNDEHYIESVATTPGSQIFLSFSYLDTEENYDSLWLYDGYDTASPLIGAFTGDEVPTLIQGSGNAITLRFYSDAATVDAGWRAVYDTLPVSGVARPDRHVLSMAFPNPASHIIQLAVPQNFQQGEPQIVVFNASGTKVYEGVLDPGHTRIALDVSGWPQGTYLAGIKVARGWVGLWKFVVAR